MVSHCPTGPLSRLTVPEFRNREPDFLRDGQLKPSNDADDVKDPRSVRFTALQGNLRESIPLADRLATIRTQLGTIAFREQLRLMTGWSNNFSASLVI